MFFISLHRFTRSPLLPISGLLLFPAVFYTPFLVVGLINIDALPGIIIFYLGMLAFHYWIMSRELKSKGPAAIKILSTVVQGRVD